MHRSPCLSASGPSVTCGHFPFGPCSLQSRKASSWIEGPPLRRQHPPLVQALLSQRLRRKRYRCRCVSVNTRPQGSCVLESIEATTIPRCAVLRPECEMMRSQLARGTGAVATARVRARMAILARDSPSQYNGHKTLPQAVDPSRYRHRHADTKISPSS